MTTIYCGATTALLLLFFFTSSIPKSLSQQEYVNNQQLNWNTKFYSTKGNLCNDVSSSCISYLTFKSYPPEYATPSSISYFLNSTPFVIAAANTLLTIPEKSAAAATVKQKARESYVLGSSIKDVPSHHVWLLECRFHHWCSGSPMRVAHEFVVAAVLDYLGVLYCYN
ncbi:hypothetical protein Fmac_031478 [Flemingia macrophylla]|uniref:Uncharacterized protein n=1 Tax=Flemingia macrophylla TaxID=520843 RepID=A0ABD1L275_9FABA